MRHDYSAEPGIAVADAEFLRWVHRMFYERLPDTLRTVRNDTTGKTPEVVPGEFRQREVQVGQHGGTELSITQEGVPDIIPPEACCLGWQESLALLAKLVESEVPY